MPVGGRRPTGSRRHGPQVPFHPLLGALRPLSRRGERPVCLSSLDLEQPDERRLVLLLERDNVDDAEPLAGA
jgi:hypothetical protein